MDTQTQDTILLDELLHNEKRVEHPSFGTIRITRPTPRKEKQIAEVRRKQFHQDYQDPSVLSKAQMESIAMERGDWTEEKRERMESLRVLVAQLMNLLEGLGYESFEKTIVHFENAKARLLELFAEKEEIREAIERYFNLDLEPDPADSRRIRDAATSTEVDDLQIEADSYRAQIEVLQKLGRAKKDLLELQSEYVRLTKDSVESRADRAEEMAMIYYLISKEDGSPLWPTFEDAWDATAEEIAFLQEELYYFIHPVTDEFREMVGKHGFTVRVPESKLSESSDDSPGHPQSSSSGDSVETAPSSSSSSPA